MSAIHKSLLRVDTNQIDTKQTTSNERNAFIIFSHYNQNIVEMDSDSSSTSSSNDSDFEHMWQTSSPETTSEVIIEIKEWLKRENWYPLRVITADTAEGVGGPEADSAHSYVLSNSDPISSQSPNDLLQIDSNIDITSSHSILEELSPVILESLSINGSNPEDVIPLIHEVPHNTQQVMPSFTSQCLEFVSNRPFLTGILALGVFTAIAYNNQRELS